MSAKRVICNMVGIARLVSSLFNPAIKACLIVKVSTREGIILTVSHSRVAGKFSFPESKHNPQ